MAEETKVEGKIEAVAKAADAPVKAVAEKVEAVAAPAVVNTPVIQTKPVAKAKPKARRTRKPAAPVWDGLWSCSNWKRPCRKAG